jgi:hypothetical protein
VVSIGGRDANGQPINLKPIGNVKELKISIDTSTLEHKESQSGQRATDLRITTETKSGLSAVLDNFDATSLGMALRGDFSAISAGAVTAEAIKLYAGAIAPLQRLKVSAVVVKRGATVLTPYTNDITPYDYTLNADAGSVLFNDGSKTVIANMTTGGVAPTAISVGATTSITIANTASVGDMVAFTGLAGADAALINGKFFTILTASPTLITINLNSTGKTITLGTPLSVFNGAALTVDYSFAAQSQVNALTQGSTERYLRFEGLNTADGNNPVVVEAFKFVIDPAKELSLINDDIAQFTLEGSLLFDALQTSGSKFFRERMLR